MTDYDEFLNRKSQLGGQSGFAPPWIPDFLFDFQRALVEWALLKGKAAIFADCGLGKTPMQLVWAENVVRKTNRPVLILTPLAVGPQTVLEGVKFGIETTRSRDGNHHGGIVITNYEKLHHFNPLDFAGVVCDESSILKHFSGATQSAVTRFMLKIPYRLLCTATAAPNDYIELGTSSEALGELGYSDMLTRFFKQTDNKPHRMEEIKQWRKERQSDGGHFGKLSFRVHQSIGQWRLKGHAVMPFWRWVASWARACRKPSDLGFDDARFILPELIEREHIVEPTRPPDGMLFTFPAFGLREERDERRRTLDERCSLVASLVEAHEYSAVWCHLNIEGDRLEHLIPRSLQVKGSDDSEYKETAAAWFVGKRCICNEPWFSAKLKLWQNAEKGTGKNTTPPTESNSLPNLSSTNASIESKNWRISSDIMRSTKQKPELINSLTERNEILKSENDIALIQITKPPRKRKSNRIESESLMLDGPVDSDDSGSVSKTTMQCLNGKEAAAQSAEAVRETGGPRDSMLTTATNPDKSEGCCVQIATLPLENSTMTRNVSSERQCICGHVSGPRRLITKSKIFGFGLNFQHCDHVVTFATHSYEQFYQSVRRCWRFGQTRPVTVDIVSTTGERYVRENMTRKAEACSVMFSELVSCMNKATRVERRADDKERVEIPSWA